jgi:hypothetical protein
MMEWIAASPCPSPQRPSHRTPFVTVSNTHNAPARALDATTDQHARSSVAAMRAPGQGWKLFRLDILMPLPAFPFEPLFPPFFPHLQSSSHPNLSSFKVCDVASNKLPQWLHQPTLDQLPFPLHLRLAPRARPMVSRRNSDAVTPAAASPSPDPNTFIGMH